MLSVLAALAMLAVAIFHDSQLIVGAGLLIVGLTFSRPITNRRQALAVVLIGAYGPLMLLDHKQWQILPIIAGFSLVISTIGQEEEEGVEGMTVKMLIGFSWCYLAIPAVCFATAFLMLFVSAVHVFVASINELAEVLDPT